MLKLHLGCGNIVLDGWLNLDLDSSVADVIHDLTKPLPFADGSVRYIFAEHMIEHVEYAEAECLLRECRRVLAPGGIVRMTTPDLAWLAMTYLSTITTQWGDLWQPRSPCALLNEGMRSWGHRYLYDRSDLRSLFARCGFGNIAFCEWRSSEDPQLAGLESRPYNHELIIEAHAVDIAGLVRSSMDPGDIAPSAEAIDLLLLAQRQELERLRAIVEAKDKRIVLLERDLGGRDSKISELAQQISLLREIEHQLIQESRGLREVLVDKMAAIESQSDTLRQNERRVGILEASIEDLARHIKGMELGLEDRDRHIDQQTAEIMRVSEESAQRCSLILLLEQKINEEEQIKRVQIDLLEKIRTESSERALLIESLDMQNQWLLSEIASRTLMLDGLQSELAHAKGILENLRGTRLGRFALRRLDN